MSQFMFGTGMVDLNPGGTNPTPIEVGVLQDITVDISFTEKELRGQLQFPVDVARGAGKITAKAKSGQFSSALYNSLLSGATVSAGRKLGVQNEVWAIPATPYQVTVANGANFYEDLGVFDATANLNMTRVASAPATGQYSANTATGQYTFAAADTTHSVQIDYSYTSAGTGKTVAYTNQLMGSATTYILTLYNTYKSKNSGIRLWSCISQKMALASKNEDHTMLDIDFTAYADPQNRIIDLYTED